MDQIERNWKPNWNCEINGFRFHEKTGNMSLVRVSFIDTELREQHYEYFGSFVGEIVLQTRRFDDDKVGRQ